MRYTDVLVAFLSSAKQMHIDLDKAAAFQCLLIKH
jgi:hypothetical protein